MDKHDPVCVCHKVSMAKLVSFIEREQPKVASQLSDCLGAGTGCGWCIPFLEKLHEQHSAGESMNLHVDHERYLERRAAYRQRLREKKKNDG
jgi:NAD(P)H-nitrite reductase large subunit